MKTHYIIALGLAFLAVFSSCKKEEPKVNEIALSTEELQVPRIGVNSDGSSITLTVTANTYWRAFIPAECDWLTFYPKASASGTEKITFTIDKNLDGGKREAVISFEDNANVVTYLHVTQDGIESAPKLNVTLPGKTFTQQDTLILLASNYTSKFYYKNGYFTSDYDLPEADNYAVVYPYDKTASFDGTSVTVNLQQKQEFKTSEKSNTAARYGAVSSTTDFNLAALYGTLRVNIYGNGDIVQFGLTSAQDKWTVVLDSPIKLAATPTPVDFVLPAASRTGCKIGVTDGTGYEVLYDIEDFDVAVGSMKEVSIKHESSAARVDLSAKGTANCYAVSGVVKAKFKATRGNEENIISGIDHVGLLWRGQVGAMDLTNKIILDDSISYEDGYVMFDTDGSQGNAVIAAYDDSGTILWSWHIWTLKYDNKLTDITIGGTTILDRNLGACANDTYDSAGYSSSLYCSGLLYQWGRKDPFGGRGQEATNSGSPVTMLDINNDDCKMTAAAPVTVATTVQNPTTVYNRSSGHWASDVADTWGGSKKTIYDPCPYGYRVPSKSDFSTNWTAANIVEVLEQVNAPGNPTGVQGFRWTVSGVTAFFAVTGQLNAGSAVLNHAYLGSDMATSSSSNRQAVCRMWMRDSNHAYIDANITISANAAGWSARRKSVSATSSSQNTYGFAVRCVKEN